MREIKFRAWDKNDKVMREVYGIQFPKRSNHGVRKNTVIEMHCSDYEGQKAIIFSDFTDSIERVELMQYTGLKDKNGKEIYEGDVLEIGNNIANISNVGFVEYNDGTFEVTEMDGKVSWNLYDCIFYPGEDSTTGKSTEPAEIIGNIYENPDLVK